MLDWFLVGRERLVKKAYDGLLLDAGGTLLQLAKPVEQTYAEIGQKYGLFSSYNTVFDEIFPR